MHSDIHYFGTYAMARLAGLKREACQTIATAAQFVDANDREWSVRFDDGGRFNVIPTAHPLVHVKNTALFDDDQRMVWLPFHFLPGNEGECMSERLICRQDSEVAREMVDHCLSLVDKPFGLQLVGIAAHVYADTFAHYGFSGVSSRWNEVDGSSIELHNDERDQVAESRFKEKYGVTMSGLLNWRRRIIDEITSEVIENATGALGHGAVMKYPDYPYLEWSFTYEHAPSQLRTSRRSNPDTFLEALERLHEMFCRLGHTEHLDQDIFPDRGLDRSRDSLVAILETKDPDRRNREAVWIKAANEGLLFGEPEPFLPYLGTEWMERMGNLDGRSSSSAVPAEPVFGFFQAAAVFRTHVLRDLLPGHGLVVA